MTGPDTAQRSLEHWSEAGRSEMEAFYALATEDYRQLAAVTDWSAALRAVATGGRLSLLDVACGSGKWPAALLASGLDPELRIEVDLLDPSAFSLAEARSVLAPPFVGAADHLVGIQELDPAAGPYDVAWAVHALYALPPDELAAGLARMVAAVRPGGLGMVAQATAASHYLAFYEAYRDSVEEPVTPFTSAEDVVAALRGLGVSPAVRVLGYRTRSSAMGVVEGFLQRCAFDDSMTLGEMEAHGPLADYLDGCRDAAGFHFDHEVQLITWSR
jgi:SAM-dependent methyltransferase